MEFDVVREGLFSTVYSLSNILRLKDECNTYLSKKVKVKVSRDRPRWPKGFR